MSAPQGWYQDPEDPARPENPSRPVRLAGDIPAQHPAARVEVGAAAAVTRAEELRREIATLSVELDHLRSEIVETRETMLLQEIGLYQYRHPLDTAVQYKAALDALEVRMRDAVKAGTAVSGAKRWVINGSEKDGARMVADYCKLILRTYNVEADNLVRGLGRTRSRPP